MDKLPETSSTLRFSSSSFVMDTAEAGVSFSRMGLSEIETPALGLTSVTDSTGTFSEHPAKEIAVARMQPTNKVFLFICSFSSFSISWEDYTFLP